MCQVKFPYHPNIYQLEFSPIKPNQDSLVMTYRNCALSQNFITKIIKVMLQAPNSPATKSTIGFINNL